MIVVAAVLKSGSVYTPTHVRILQAMVRRHLPQAHRFVVLTDVTREFAADRDIVAVPLRHDWPGWWSKVELYEPLLFNQHTSERIVYFDIDVVITGDLSDLAARTEKFICVGDTYRRPPRYPTIGCQSSVMAWDHGTLSGVYDQFTRNAESAMDACKRIGDQKLLELWAPRPAFWEHVLPGQVLSYRRDCLRRLPDGARVVDFHGKIKPWAVGDAWVKKHYRA